MYQLVSIIEEIVPWASVASILLALLTVVMKFALAVCDIGNHFNLLFSKKSQASRMLTEATDEKSPYWVKRLAMKEYIKIQSRIITEKDLSNPARAVYLSIVILLAFAACVAYICYLPSIDSGLKQVVILAALLVYLVFLLIMELMALFNVPCAQGIFFKARALCFKLSRRREIKIISIDGMFAKAMQRPYIVIDARKNNSIPLWDELPEVVRKDDIDEGSLKNGITYFVCSDYGVNSGKYAKELQEKGFEPYSVWCAFSQYKKFKRIIYELHFLKEEKLLVWQRDNCSKI